MDNLYSQKQFKNTVVFNLYVQKKCGFFLFCFYLNICEHIQISQNVFVLFKSVAVALGFVFFPHLNPGQRCHLRDELQKGPWSPRLPGEPAPPGPGLISSRGRRSQAGPRRERAAAGVFAGGGRSSCPCCLGPQAPGRGGRLARPPGPAGTEVPTAPAGDRCCRPRAPPHRRLRERGERVAARLRPAPSAAASGSGLFPPPGEQEAGAAAGSAQRRRWERGAHGQD